MNPLLFLLCYNKKKAKVLIVVMTEIKRSFNDLLNGSDRHKLQYRIIDYVIIVLIISNVAAVMIEPSVRDPNLLYFLRIFEFVSVIAFTVEYLLRVWVADLNQPQKGKLLTRIAFIVTPMALIDLAAILPFYIPLIITMDLRVLRMLRIFRLLRIFKTNRYTSALSTVFRVIKNKADQLLSSLFVVIVLMIISSVMMYNVESIAQPDLFISVFDALWWSVATLTTIGYGDIFPITALGRIFAAVIAVLGIGIVAIPTGIIASGFTELVQKNEHMKCPHCGKDI
jgi:voltage-gated potassium channel